MYIFYIVKMGIDQMPNFKTLPKGQSWSVSIINKPVILHNTSENLRNDPSSIDVLMRLASPLSSVAFFSAILWAISCAWDLWAPLYYFLFIILFGRSLFFPFCGFLFFSFQDLISILISCFQLFWCLLCFARV